MKLFSYLFPRVMNLPMAQEFNGAVQNIGSSANLFAQVEAYSMPGGGYCNFAAVNGAANVTLNAATVPGGIHASVMRISGGAAINATLDSTLNIVSAMAGASAFVGQTSTFRIANANTGTVTMVVGDANTTLSGTTTVVTVNFRDYQIKITNLTPANGINSTIPAGAAATNTTTTTAAVSVPAAGSTSVVIPVTASTGMIANQSVLGVTMTNGQIAYGLVTNIATLNITISVVPTYPIASGATVSVFNPQVTVTGMFAMGTTGVIA